MKFHCLLNWELQDGDGKACLIKRTLPFKAWTGWLNVSVQAGLWKMEDFCSSGVPANAQRRPLTEITPPLYNPMPLLYGGQEVKRERCRSTDKQTWRVCHTALSLRMCFSAHRCCCVQVCHCCLILCEPITDQPSSHTHMSPEMFCL